MNDTANCPRCGIRRRVKAERGAGLCRDCYHVEPNWPALPPQAPVETGLGVCREDTGPSTMPPSDARSRLSALIELRARITREIDYLEAAATPVKHRRPEAICGTDAGYMRHIHPRKGEVRTEPCEACKRAHARAERKRRKDRRRSGFALRSVS